MSEGLAGTAGEMLASALLFDASALNARPGDRCRLKTVPIQDGVELQLWEGSFAAPWQMSILDDSERIHFTWVVEGSARMELGGGRLAGEREAVSGAGVIHSCPGEKGRFRQHGDYSSVVVMVRPDVLLGWSEVAATELQETVRRGRCYVDGVRGAELQAAAWHLHRALGATDGADRNSLELQARGLSFVAAFLEGANFPLAASLSGAEKIRLKRARDILLANLAKAPTLAALAAASGLSLIRLKRGFRALFGNSVYGLFMRERMHEARRRLCRGEAVIRVAADLGYTNASHFAAAFRKQFGVNPAVLKRGRN
ncbi:MAG: helix-turn-helix transcriptional regulator [Rhodocyclaceae bacterium]|nr:helix-turn-helix transcriptional regulator [Rhodocyclaceae bacterium]